MSLLVIPCERVNLSCDLACLSASQLTHKKFSRLFALSQRIIRHAGQHAGTNALICFAGLTVICGVLKLSLATAHGGRRLCPADQGAAWSRTDRQETGEADAGKRCHRRTDRKGRWDEVAKGSEGLGLS